MSFVGYISRLHDDVMTWKYFAHYWHIGPVPCPDSNVRANMGPIWGRQDPDGPHVGAMNFAIWEVFWCLLSCSCEQTVVPTVGLPVIWCASALIWRHFNTTWLRYIWLVCGDYLKLTKATVDPEGNIIVTRTFVPISDVCTSAAVLAWIRYASLLWK